jgi:hypothetical protein
LFSGYEFVGVVRRNPILKIINSDNVKKQKVETIVELMNKRNTIVSNHVDNADLEELAKEIVNI